MNKDDVENMLDRMQTPEPEKVIRHPELKIPLMSYKKSSKAGLWLLLLPLTFALALILKLELNIESRFLTFLSKFFSFIDDNVVLTYLIPLIFIGLPLVAMIINLLAICHFQKNSKSRELIITIKYRPLNIVIFLLSFAVLIFFLLPDKLAF